MAWHVEALLQVQEEDVEEEVGAYLVLIWKRNHERMANRNLSVKYTKNRIVSKVMFCYIYDGQFVEF